METQSISMWRITWNRFKRHKLALYSSVVLILLLGLAFLGPWIMKVSYGYEYETIPDKLNYHGSPSFKHLLGTDDLGRDVVTRLAYAGRISLGIGLAAALFSALFGVLYGATSSYIGGHVDAAMMRFVDMMLSLPVLPLMIMMAAIDLHKLHLGYLANSNAGNMARIIFIVVVFGWMGAARLVRGEILSLKERDFIEAARALGASHFRIIFQHLLPNALAPIIVSATLAMGSTMLYESSLSFLGLGVRRPTPSWGNMLTDAQLYFKDNLSLAIYPGLLILLAVISFNFIGDGLRDALDPKQFIESDS